MPVVSVRTWDEADHPRGPDGKFAGVPGLETKWGKGKRGSVRHDTLTAKTGGKKAGHIRLTDGGSEIDELQVSPDKRGRGIASQLMREAIAEFGHQTMRLHASPVGKGGMNREQLMAFYAKFGFKPEPERGAGHMVRVPDSQRGGQPPGESRRRKGHDNGELHYYWTKDPEGLAKWADKPHPWTALYNHLKKYIKNPRIAKATTSAWYKDVFGRMPNEGDHDGKGRSAHELYWAGGQPEWRASVSDRPWDGSAARFTPEQWRRSCLLDTGVGDPDSKSRYKLPVREPDGTLNRTACHAAAAALAGGRGGVQATPEQKTSAKRKLAELYRNELNEDPPSSLSERIGMPPFAKGASFTKGKAMDDMTMEECQAAYHKALADGDKELASKLKAKLDAMRPDDDEGAARAKFGEGPGGSQKGPSIKAIKAQIAQAREDGDEEMVKALQDKLAKLQGTGGRAADPRALARSLPVIRSAQGGGMAPVITEEPAGGERAAAPGGGVFVRASYRAARDGEDGPIMTLRFSQFNNWYEIDSAREGRFLERVAPGAFTKTIGERGGQVKTLFNHGHDNQIGEKILGKIITLEERKDGAYAEIELFDTSYNRDLLPGLRAGAYGSSFMFNVMDDAWEDRPERSEANPNGLPERTVRALRLLEFGPVTWPANPGTTAGLRSGTDAYCDGLRATAPDVYNNLEEQFGEFRSALPSTSAIAEAVDTDTSRKDEAALRTDAPVDDHADEPTTNSAETRRARLMLAGVIRDE